jgi:hypothetical protein
MWGRIWLMVMALLLGCFDSRLATNLVGAPRTMHDAKGYED